MYIQNTHVCIKKNIVTSNTLQAFKLKLFKFYNFTMYKFYGIIILATAKCFKINCFFFASIFS